MIKLLVLDLDNTMLSSDGHISDKNKQAVSALQKTNNTAIILASGRGPRGMVRYIKELGLEAQYHIANNGTNIFRLGEEVQETCVFDREEYLRFIDYLHAHKIDFMCFEKDYLVYDTAEDEKEPIAKYIGDTPLYERDPKTCQSPFKIGVYYRDEAEHETIMAFPAKTIELHQADKHFVDVNPKGISKRTAMEMLAKRLGIEPHEIACAGDNENDVPMLSGVGLSFAVGNAVEAAKQAADIVLSQTNNEDAVAHLIYDHLLAEAPLG